MMSIDDGGPVYPMRFGLEYYGSLSLRDYFAAFAMQSILTKSQHYGYETIADGAYRQADAMLEQRKK